MLTNQQKAQKYINRAKIDVLLIKRNQKLITKYRLHLSHGLCMDNALSESIIKAKIESLKTQMENRRKDIDVCKAEITKLSVEGL